MRIEGNIQLNREEWDTLVNELLYPDSTRAQATKEFFDRIDRDIIVSGDTGHVSVRSAVLNVDGLRAAIMQRSGASRTVQKTVSVDIAARSQREYAKLGSVNAAYNLEIEARESIWASENAYSQIMPNAA